MKKKIQVILGSTRQGRFGEQPANFIMEELKNYPEIEAELIDLRDWPLPFFDEKTPTSSNGGNYVNELGKKWADKIGEADGYIWVTPEYNHSTSAVLKNAIDWIYKEWNHKPVAFISYGSAAGGARAVEHLRNIAVELQMAPTRTAIHLSSYYHNLDENGKYKFDSFKDTAKALIEQLSWWTDALKTAREK